MYFKKWELKEWFKQIKDGDIKWMAFSKLSKRVEKWRTLNSGVHVFFKIITQVCFYTLVSKIWAIPITIFASWRENGSKEYNSIIEKNILKF